MADAFATINGQSRRIEGGSYSVSWGMQPGVCGLAVGFNFNGTAPGAVVTLEIKFRGLSIKLRDALVTDPRTSGGVTQSPTVNFSVLDRRWRWLHAGRVYGSYNVETRYGTLERPKTPQELATLLFQQLGEAPGTFDVGALPVEPRPQKIWIAADARDELEQLCAEFGCVPLFDPIRDRAYIARISEGDEPPTGATAKIIDINISTVTPPQPSGFRIVGGESLFQTVLTLAEPVGLEVTGSIKNIVDLSYKPPGGWESIDPWDFPSLNTKYTDQNTGEELFHRELAQSSVWRMYRLGGQKAGGWAPRALLGSPVAPQSRKDLGPFTGGLLDRDVVTGERLPAYVRGVFADERLGYDNCKANTRFPGSVSIDSERGIVTFDKPLFKYGTDGKPYRADVVLIAAYACSRDGVPIRWEYSAANTAQGLKGGEAVEIRDEIVREIIEFDASRPPGSDNLTAVDRQLKYYADALANRFKFSKAVNATFGGLLDYKLDGQLRSITWSFSKADTPKTQCSWNSERSTAIIPWEKRNDQRALRRGRQLLRYQAAADRTAASRESASKTQ